MLLLIDADITCYSSASSAEEEIEWDADTWTLYGDLKKAKDSFKYYLDKYVEATKLSDFKLCFSSKTNFRKDILPSYKGNRKGRKPVGYGALKEWAKENYPYIEKDGLEADDCLGILATKFKGKAVILSMDKDLLTIPGKMYKMSQDGSGVWEETDEKQADYRFLIQALTGDSTDGYGGVPGVGPKKAEELLKKHGAVWKTVEDAYLKAGMTKEEALQQARMARILRVEDYDFEKGEVKLWNP